MGGVDSQKQSAKPHRLGDKAAQRRDALFDRRPGHDGGCRLGVEPQLQLPPEPLVGPVLDMIVEAALDIEAAAGVRAHRAERKTALMADIDQLGRDRRRLAEHAEPAEGIDALIMPERRLRDRLPADAMKAIAAGYKIADDLAFDAVLMVAHARLISGNVMQTGARRLVDRRNTGGAARLHQVMGDLGLAIDGDDLAG